MRPHALLPLLAALAACPAWAGTRTDGTLRFDTSFGPVTLLADPGSGRVTGRYGQDGGHLLGDRVGSALSGVWLQPSGLHPCPRALSGYRNWGTFNLSLPERGPVKAHWGYCEGPQILTWDLAPE